MAEQDVRPPELKKKKRRGPRPGSKRYGGRSKGTPNRSTLELVRRFEARDFDPVDQIITLMASDKIPDSDKLFVCLRLLKFIYPERKAIEVAANDDNAKDVIYATAWSKLGGAKDES